MSSFEVEIKTISEVIKHPNADRLTIYKVNGLAYQFISNVKYEVGDKVVYFPVDSVMTQDLIELFGLGTMLAGKNHDRVKTVKLRGEISQGFVADVKSVADFVGCLVDDLDNINLTEILKIEKWEPPVVPCQNGELAPLPDDISMYDIEGADNNPQVIDWLIENNVKVEITEKLEGQNFSVTVDNDDKVFVNQRRFTIIEKEGGEHDMWRVARKEKIIDLVNSIKEFTGAYTVTLYGEHLGPGVQGNYYKLKENTVRFFDLKINGKWYGADDFSNIMRHFERINSVVPVLFNGTIKEYFDVLGVNDVRRASNGKSILNKDRLREGIVIKPLKVICDHPFISKIGNRLIIKQRDPIYLDKTGN